jgi:hypothetical protein
MHGSAFRSTRRRKRASPVGQKFRNPLGSFRITGGEGRLRRNALEALQCWRPTLVDRNKCGEQRRSSSSRGGRRDSVTVAEVGFRLSERGFAPSLPCASMAYSADQEMRQLAAATLPSLSGVDFDAVESLSRDVVTNVRSELAISLGKLVERDFSAETSRQSRLLS